LKPLQYLHYNRKTTFRKNLPRNVVYYLYNLIPVLVAGIAAALVILIVIDGTFFIPLVTSLIYDKIIIKYEMIGLFLNSVFSSIIPIPTELITSMLLLSKVNKILIFIILDAGSIVGGYLAYFIGMRYHSFIQSRLNELLKVTFLSKLLNIVNGHAGVLLILSPWLPFIGDSLCILAGTTKYDLRKYLIYISVGKTIKVFAIIISLASIIPYL
jgi:membrane protein YqaA with SNARE-associated domain